MPDTPQPRPHSEGSVNSLEDAIAKQLAGHGALGNGEILTGYVVLTRTMRFDGDGRPTVCYGCIPSHDIDDAAKLGMLDIAHRRTYRQIDSDI